MSNTIQLLFSVQKIKKKVGDRVVLLQNLKSVGTIQEIDWYKNGQKVQAGKDEKYQGGINQSPSLLVGSLQEHDSGLYECDLIVKESQIKLHILVDLTVERKYMCIVTSMNNRHRDFPIARKVL